MNGRFAAKNARFEAKNARLFFGFGSFDFGAEVGMNRRFGAKNAQQRLHNEECTTKNAQRKVETNRRFEGGTGFLTSR